ncbi:MAG: hypothetical protein ACXVEI_05535 [Actinomycetota bacterium]
MHIKMRTPMFIALAVVTALGLLTQAPAAMARGTGVTFVHSTATYTYLNAPPQTFQGDHGRITGVTPSSISLLRPDGITVTLAASASSCVFVNGYRSALQNLVVGQDVLTASDATETQSVSIRAGFPKIRPNVPTCAYLGSAVHGDITDTLSDGTIRQRSWDRGRITGISAGTIQILRPDNVTVISHPTRNTKVFGAVYSYWRLRLGEKVAIQSLKQVDPSNNVMLIAMTIRAYRR